MPQYTLDFPVNVGSSAPVKSLAEAVREVAERTKLGEGNLRAFEQVLNETAQRTGNVKSALADLAGKQSVFQAFAKEVQAYSREAEKAQGETQKWGRMMELASQENAKRDQRASDSARKSADEIIKQHERIQTVLGRQGARLGGTALGQSVGLPGIGRGVGSILGAMGLSGGTMAAVGGAAAGIFAGIEFTKSLDNLAKWSQEQKNAAAETGMTITEMQQLSRASEITGVNLLGVAKSTGEMAKQMIQGGSRAKEISSTLSQLGLDASVAFEKPGQTLGEIEEALGKVKDPADRARMAEALLGEEGRKLAASLDAIRDSSGKGIIDQHTMDELTHAHEQMAQVGIAWDLLKSKFATPLDAVLTFTNKTIETGEVGANIIDATLSSFGLIRPNKYRNVGSGESDPYTKKYLGKQDAEDTAARNTFTQKYRASHGTPEEQYKGTDETIAADQKALNDKFLVAKTITQQEFSSGQAKLDARTASAAASRKAAESYRSQLENLQRKIKDQGGIAPTDAPGVFGELKEMPKTFDRVTGSTQYKSWMGQLQHNAPGALQQTGAEMLHKQFPGLETGDYSKLYSPMGKQDKTFTDDLSRQEREARESNERAKKASDDRVENINRTTSDQTEVNESNLHLHTAQRSAFTQQTANQRDVSSAGVAQLSYKDQTQEIAEAFAAKAAPLSKSIADLQATPGVDQEQQDKIKRDIEAKESELQKLENDRLTQSVEALSKFNESVDKASKAIGQEFGGFISGLAAAGREGHAGTYAKSFMLGQSDKMISNMASSLYKPGMFQIPGQGTPDNPTALGKALSGTLMGMDPKAQQAADLKKSGTDTLAAIKANTAQLQKSAQAVADPAASKDSALATADATLTSATDLNTKATQDNTAALLAVYQGLGGDPTSLGIAGLPAFTPLSGGSSAPISVLAGGGGELSSAVRAASSTGAPGGSSITEGIRFPSASGDGSFSPAEVSGAVTSMSRAASGIGGSAVNMLNSNNDGWVYSADPSGSGLITRQPAESVTSSVSFPGQASTGPGGIFGQSSISGDPGSGPGLYGQLSTGPSGTTLNFDSNTSDNWDSMAGDLDQLANGGGGAPSLASAVTSLPDSLSAMPVSSYQIATGAQSLSTALAPAFSDILKTGAAFNAPVPSVSSGFALNTPGGTSAMGLDPLGPQMAPSSPGLFTNSNPLTNLFNTNGTATTGQQLGAGLQVAGEAFGAYNGIRQITKGGLQNTMAGIGTTAMSLAPLTGPAAPFVEAGGAALSLISSLMGNPTEERQAHVNSELFNNQYIAPEAYTRTMDISGGYASMGFRGNVRATDLSSIPIIQQPYPDPRHGVIVPGTILSPFGGGGPSTTVGIGNINEHTTDTGSNGSQGGQGSPSVVNITNHVSAIDGDSVANFFQNNSQALGDGVVTALNKGGSDMANRIRTL